MPAVLARPRTEGTRKRRAHVKSRKGCGNCKLRRVKCDEEQPSCGKCRVYGVSCNYSGPASSLDLDAQGSFQVSFGPIAVSESSSSDEGIIEVRIPTKECSVSAWLPPLNEMSITSNLAAVVDESLQSEAPSLDWMNSTWHFTGAQVGILSRFRERTSLTIGNTNMAPLYRDPVCQLACQHAFLMHMLLSVTLMHDAHLTNPCFTATGTESSRAALVHWNTASKLFNEILSQPISPAYRDAIWATGVFLGAASFWSISSTNPYDVWPLKPEEPGDLAWLRIGEGKKHLWRLAQPLRSDSIFCGLVKDYSCLRVPEWATVEKSTESATQLFARVMRLFGLFDKSESVYRLAVLALSKCPNVKLTQENSLEFLYIMSVITPEFLELLEIKDMKAIFIMGWWYIMLTTGDLWWMCRRARIEGQAIRIWMRRQHGGEEYADMLDEIERHAGQDDSAGR